MKKAFSFKPLGGSLSAILDPLLAKRGHVDAALALSWPELAGEKLAGRTQPIKVNWPRRTGPDDPFMPGTLVVACEGSVALDLQYQTSQLIDKMNRFFGYAAVNKIRIEQRSIDLFRQPSPRVQKTLMPEDQQKLERSLGNIDNEELRASLLRLGASIKSSSPA